MTRCPNCGSSVRTGAKFCTTCGFRLPVESEAPADAPAPRSPFDLTSSTSVASRWPQTDETGEASAGSETAARVDADTSADPADVQASEPAAELAAESSESESDSQATSASFSGWPSFGESASQGSGWDSAPTNGTQESQGWPAESPESQPGAQEETAVWSSDPPMGDAVSTNDQAFDEIPGAHEPVAGSEGSGDPNDLSAFSWLQSIDKPAPAETESEIQEPDAPAAAAEEPEDARPLPAAAEEAEQPATEPAAAITAEEPVDTSTSHERANQLLDELRALLPSLGGVESASSDVSNAVAGALEALLADSGSESERFQSLRAAVATAQARPRDVDIMLDLVARADTIAAVLAAHDRYVAGITDAVAKLRGEAKEEPAPRW